VFFKAPIYWGVPVSARRAATNKNHFKRSYNFQETQTHLYLHNKTLQMNNYIAEVLLLVSISDEQD